MAPPKRRRDASPRTIRVVPRGGAATRPRSGSTRRAKEHAGSTRREKAITHLEGAAVRRGRSRACGSARPARRGPTRAPRAPRRRAPLSKWRARTRTPAPGIRRPRSARRAPSSMIFAASDCWRRPFEGRGTPRDAGGPRAARRRASRRGAARRRAFCNSRRAPGRAGPRRRRRALRGRAGTARAIVFFLPSTYGCLFATSPPSKVSCRGVLAASRWHAARARPRRVRCARTAAWPTRNP